MTRKEFLERVNKTLGIEVPVHLLTYAHAKGAIDNPQVLTGCHRRYTAKHVEQFVEYIRRRQVKKGPSSKAKAGA